MHIRSSWVLPSLFLLYALNYMDRSVLGMVGETVQRDMGFSDAQMGILHSLLLIALLFLLLPCSALNDLRGRRSMLGFAAALWSAAMLGTGLATGFASFAAARLAGSVNDAFTGSGGTSWLSDLYPPEKRGRILGLFLMSAPMGMALGTLTGGAVLAVTGSWRAAFFLFVGPGIGLALLMPHLPDTQIPARRRYFVGVSAMLRSRSLVLAGLAAGLYNVVLYSYQAWTPGLLLRAYALQNGTAGLMFSAMLLASTVGPWLGGNMADRWQRRTNTGRVCAAALGVALCVVSKLFFYGCVGRVGLPVILMLGLLDGVLTMLPLPLFFNLVQDVADVRYRSVAVGIMGALSFLAGGAWGPVAAGVLSGVFGGGAEGLRAALLLLALCGTGAVLLCLALKPYYRRERRDG